MPTNYEFLSAIFGTSVSIVHVTDFKDDPGAIPPGKHLMAWRGNYFGQYSFGNDTNQYFTISTFKADERGDARRRKSLYSATHCIVLDDVREKLSMAEVSKLPSPSWVLETSGGSEQWGYILSTPCTDRTKAENLLDGLVSNGLAPEGRDPGMKGVTRYVRLPDGYNTKASRWVNGAPFKCRMLQWNPFNTVTLEQLASPFHVDLNAARRESRVDGASNIADHPLLQISDLIHVKEVRGNGRFDITCPWVDEHTNADDSGSAVFTNGDGTIGFKCHHGACQERTGRNLLDHIEVSSPGFSSVLSGWQMRRAFADLATPAIMVESPVVPILATDPLADAIRQLRSEIPGSTQSVNIATVVLKTIDSLPEIQKINWHSQVRDIMNWDKREFDRILKDLRATWYSDNKAGINFFDDTIYVGEQNQFFDRKKRMWYSAEAYQNVYAHLDSDARKEALQGGRVSKVDKLDFAPMKPPIFEEQGILYGNSWSSSAQVIGVDGDASPWLNHFDLLGWGGEQREHCLKWMAFTLLHPDIKINHMIIFGSGEGCGKDWLLAPLTKAMGRDYTMINAEELLEGFNDYLLSTKYLHINEAELGDRQEAMAVSAKLKPLAAAPPDRLRVNEKFAKKVSVRNIVSVTMTTNSLLPVSLKGQSRRIFALWTDLNVRNARGDMTPEWQAYWTDHWAWMDNGGADICINHLRTKVDISKFNPGLPPPVTDYLRSIVDSGKSPLMLTVESLINHKLGALVNDVVTLNEINAVLITASAFHADLMFCSEIKHALPASRLTTLLKEMMQGHYSVNSEIGVLWIIRNHHLYSHLPPSEVAVVYKNKGVVQSTNNVVHLQK